MERQLLGFSLSAKPLSEVLESLIFSATHKIGDIYQGNASQDIKIAAVVTEVRVIITKKTGAEMAFVKVRDDTGSIELVVFPKIFQSTRNHWVESKPLLITGRVDVRDDEPSLIVNQISTRDEVEIANDKLFLKIPEGIKAEDLKDLRTLLIKYPGNQSVVLKFQGQKREVELPIKISWSQELARQITDCLEGKVELD